MSRCGADECSLHLRLPLLRCCGNARRPGGAAALLCGKFWPTAVLCRWPQRAGSSSRSCCGVTHRAVGLLTWCNAGAAHACMPACLPEVHAALQRRGQRSARDILTAAGPARILLSHCASRSKLSITRCMHSHSRRTDAPPTPIHGSCRAEATPTGGTEQARPLCVPSAVLAPPCVRCSHADPQRGRRMRFRAKPACVRRSRLLTLRWCCGHTIDCTCEA